MDVTKFIKDPVPLQPKSTKTLLSYATYLIGPNKVIIFNRSQGREFIFADRFRVEIVYILTQKVDPQIENEQDPARKLQMISTHLKIVGRMEILKSLALLKSKFLTEAQKAMNLMFGEPMEGL